MRGIVFITGFALSACSGGGTPLIDRDGNGSSRARPTAPSNAQAAALLGGGAAAGCKTLPSFSAGALSDVEPSTATMVKDGDTFDGSTVNVSCSVKPSGSDGFEVSTYVFAEAGLSIEGVVDKTGATSSAKMTFKTTTGAWQSESCRLETSRPSMGVAAGRYWGLFACTGATSTNGDTCDVFGQIRFESCATE